MASIMVQSTHINVHMEIPLPFKMVAMVTMERLGTVFQALSMLAHPGTACQFQMMWAISLAAATWILVVLANVSMDNHRLGATVVMERLGRFRQATMLWAHLKVDNANHKLKMKRRQPQSCHWT
eukprot:1867270-Karenia_brevis.AAC.1